MVPARPLSIVGLLLAVLALAACERAASPHPAADPAVLAAFQQAQAQWRAERFAELTSPDGWTSLVGLHWLDPGVHRVGSDHDNGIRLAVGPAHLGVFTVRDGKAVRVPVTLGYVDGALIEVRDGLEEGDAVVTAGKVALREGSAVQVLGQDKDKSGPAATQAATR